MTIKNWQSTDILYLWKIVVDHAVSATDGGALRERDKCRNEVRNKKRGFSKINEKIHHGGDIEA